jgi:hypothetical protein
MSRVAKLAWPRGVRGMLSGKNSTYADAERIHGIAGRRICGGLGASR